MKNIKVVNVWRGIFAAEWKDKLNARPRRELFRKIGGVWFTGEAHPTGTKSGPLRAAPPAIAAALDSAT